MALLPRAPHMSKYSNIERRDFKGTYGANVKYIIVLNYSRKPIKENTKYWSSSKQASANTAYKLNIEQIALWQGEGNEN